MDADPITTFFIAIFFGGSSGGLISWWMKGVIERSWRDRARELDAKVAAQAKETEQLRQHSLGLQAERLRNFEADRRQACVETYARIVDAMHDVLVFTTFHADLSNEEKNAELMNTLVAAREATRRTALFISPALFDSMSGVCSDLFDVFTGSAPQRGWDEWGREQEKAVDGLREAIRDELGYVQSNSENANGPLALHADLLSV